MNRWPFAWMPVYESVCECGHHRVRIGDEEVCVNVMCELAVEVAIEKEKAA